MLPFLKKKAKLKKLTTLFALLPFILLANSNDSTHKKHLKVLPYVDANAGLLMPNAHLSIGFSNDKYGLGATATIGESNVNNGIFGIGIEGRAKFHRFLGTAEMGIVPARFASELLLIAKTPKPYYRVSGAIRFWGIFNLGGFVALKLRYRVYDLVPEDWFFEKGSAFGIFFGISLPDNLTFIEN